MMLWLYGSQPIDYNDANYMDISKQSSNGNDYAVAKALNSEILKMIALIAMADLIGLPEDHEIKKLNRAYILVVNEIQDLYDQNPELAAIKPEPIWKCFDVLKTSSWEINEFLEDPENDLGQAHIARIDRLCILSGVDAPSFSTNQISHIEYAKKAISEYGQIIDDTNKKIVAEKANQWRIPEYYLTYKLDGTIWINDLLKIKKANAGSTTERLIEQAIKNPNKLFKPDLGQVSRNLSTILSSAGFTKATKQLFFPTVSTSKGILFRPNISADQARIENIDTTKLDLILKGLGARTEPHSRT